MRAHEASYPVDQAHGLRQLFAARRSMALAVVSNPQMAHGGLLLERLCTAVAESGRRVLLIDAGERSPAARDLAAVDLAVCVERLSDGVGYLAARGLAMRHVDARGGTGDMLDAIAAADPGSDVLVLHASAPDLCRAFAAHSRWRHGNADSMPVRPILLADDRPGSVTHAFAAMKWLVQRGQLWVHDLLLAVGRGSPRAQAIPTQLAGCADRFVGAMLGHTACIDPSTPATDPTPSSLARLVALQLAPAAGHERTPHLQSPFTAGGAVPAPSWGPSPHPIPTPARTRHAHPEH